VDEIYFFAMMMFADLIGALCLLFCDWGYLT